MITNLLHYVNHAEMANLSVASREHLLLVGAPGTGKSLFARQVFSHFSAVQFFAQLTKFSDEATLFGPLDIAALRKGHYQFIYKGTLLDAELAFIDEIFDASDVLLRSLLGILNERQFHRGSFSIQCPLISCIATANYTRMNEVTDAILDRFLFQMPTPSLEREERIALHNGTTYESFIPSTISPIPPIPPSLPSIPIPVSNALRDLCEEYAFSPRRERKVARAMRVKAALACRQEVLPDDLLIFQNTIPFQKQLLYDCSKKIAAIVEKLQSEQQQLAQIAAIRWDDKDSIEAAKSCLNAIKQLQSISPCSDEVQKERDNKLEKAQSRHRSCLRSLGVL